MKRWLLIAFLILLMAVPALAHQPRIVTEATYEHPVIVDEPEVSKAYYAELNGTEHIYRIESDREFLLYVNILSPDIDGARTDFVIEAMSPEVNILLLKGEDYDWVRYHEEFAGDDYLRGPEAEKMLKPGTYDIKIYNLHNKGKYSLAIGKKESFPPWEIARALWVLPKIKKHFFGKSPISAFLNLFGIFSLVFILIISGVVYLSYRIIRAKTRKRK